MQRLLDKEYTAKINEEDYKGEKADPRLAEGPVVDRKCTDVACAGLFVVFWVGIVFVAMSGFSNGNPKMFLHGMDYDGNLCGMSDGFEDYPIIYFGKPFKPEEGVSIKEHLSKTLCVKSCPAWDGSGSPPTLECKPNEFYKTCETTTSQSETDDKPLGYDSASVANMYCFPNNYDLAKGIDAALDFGAFSKGIQDIERAWSSILIVALLASILSAIYMFLIRKCAKVMVWGLIGSFVAGFILFGGFLYYQYHTNNELTGLRNLAYVCWVVGVVFAGLAYYFRDKLTFVINIMEAAAEFVGSEPTTLILPPIIMVAMTVFLIFWIAALIYLFTCGTREGQNEMPFAGWKWETKTLGMLGFHAIALLWNASFFIAFLQFTIAGAVVFWYFSRKTDTSNRFVKSLKLAIFYHMGSIAFGSLVLSIVFVLRFTFEYLKDKIKEADGGDKKEGEGDEGGERREGEGGNDEPPKKKEENIAVTIAIKCCSFCLEIFEKWMKFLNNHAYIETILTGKPFFDASVDGFFLVLRNAPTFAMNTGVATWFNFIGKTVICVISCMLGFQIITRVEAYSNEVTETTYLVIVFAIVSYLVGSVFMEVWSIAAETILHCYLVDLEVHDNEPKHCPEKFKEFLEAEKFEPPSKEDEKKEEDANKINTSDLEAKEKHEHGHEHEKTDSNHTTPTIHMD